MSEFSIEVTSTDALPLNYRVSVGSRYRFYRQLKPNHQDNFILKYPNHMKILLLFLDLIYLAINE